jgi:hypothetical protein
LRTHLGSQLDPGAPLKKVGELLKKVQILTLEEKQEYHNRGEREYAEGGIFFGQRTPWRGPFESEEHYDERREAQEKGYDNALKQDPPL